MTPIGQISNNNQRNSIEKIASFPLMNLFLFVYLIFSKQHTQTYGLIYGTIQFNREIKLLIKVT